MREISKFWISVIVITIVVLYSLPASASGENEELNKIKVMWDQRVPMRDGVELSADIFLPKDEGRYPTLLMRNPYTKSTRRAGIPYDFISYFAERGYALVGQDVRGRGDSDGEFGYYHADVEDGYDSVEWAASQPWSNGKVCMFGLSYLGTVQWLAAKVRPPHLVCLASTAAAGDFMDEIGYGGGVFHAMGNLGWVNSVSGRTWQDLALVDLEERGLFDWEDVLWHRPLTTMDEVFGRKMKIYQDYLEHPTMDDYWKQIRLQPDDFRNIELPVLHITGWFDGDQPGAMHYWRGMQQYSTARDKQYIVIGPWDHVGTFFGGPPFIGEMQFGPESMIDRLGLHLEFFDHYLKGTSQHYDQPKARLYITGINEWRTYNAYPPREAKEMRFFLHSGGHANTLDGDGRLSLSVPGTQNQDSYTFDPKKPVPTYAVDRKFIAIDHRQPGSDRYGVENRPSIDLPQRGIPIRVGAVGDSSITFDTDEIRSFYETIPV